MNLTHVDLILWIVNAASAAVALAALLLRGLAGRWPMFCTFLSIKTASEIAQAISSHNYKAYFFTYWISEAVQYLAQFLLLREVFASVFATFPFIPKSFFKVLWPTLWIAGVGSIVIAAMAQGGFVHKITATSVGMERTLLMAWCVCFIVCAIGTSWMGLGWRLDSLLIGAGSALLNATGVLTLLLFGVLSLKKSQMVDNLHSLLEILVFLLWSVALKAPPEPSTLAADDETTSTIKDFAESTIGARNSI